MYHNIDPALVKVSNDFLIASDKGPITVLFLLDLSATFDTVNHQILLQSLENLIGIRRTPLDWFKSYLLINLYMLTRCLPCAQNLTVLEPILFTLYMLPLEPCY